MSRVLIFAAEKETGTELAQRLSRYDLACFVTSYENGMRETVTSTRPDIVLFEVNEQQSIQDLNELIVRLKKTIGLPVIALITENLLENLDFTFDADDFIIIPYNLHELKLRITRVLRRAVRNESRELIKCEGLAIDPVTCEVILEGIPVELTFKEYELLKLMASNRGRVFTREALLDKIWGFDYYGGDRTVDVHIRRLRSKIEDSNHIYIETVRNIGYRFVK
jgi:DNA-binding response OmpR family regulator